MIRLPSTRKVFSSILGTSLLFVAATSSAGTEVWTDWGSITSLEGGWGNDTMSVRTNSPFVNSSVVSPALNGRRFCAVTTAGYATDPNDKGHSLYHTMALAAFLNKKDVRLLLDGCVFDKPKIIGIQVR